MQFLNILILTLMLNGSLSAQSSDSSSIPCAADAQWLNTNANTRYSRASQLATALSLLAHLSKGGECSGAEITITATYLSESLDFICSGTIRQAMSMTSQVQAFNIEIRPFAQLDFLRWRNQPGVRGMQQGKQLTCMNVDGTSDLGDTDRQRAEWIRLSAGVLPPAGGLAVTEVMIRITP
jgi:hypothetical protein